MAQSNTWARPAGAFRFVLAAGFLVMLGANLPGHLSYDSVAQLHEGRFQVRETWGPALYAWLLGFFDRIIPGTALYVTASGLVLFLALAVLGGLRGRTGWIAVATALFAVLTPQVLIYQAIVWKDVMFANAAVAGMTCLALAARDWDRPARRWPWLALTVVLLAAAGLLRQNGLIVTVFAAMALGWVASRGRWWRGAVWGFAGLALVLIAARAIDAAAQPRPAVADTAISQGLRILQNYDLVGAAALDPGYRTPRLDRVDPAAAAVLRARAKDYYSGERIDYIDHVIGDAMAVMPDKVVRAEWLDLILKRPDLYLKVRWEDFRWVFLTPVIDRCLGAYVGIDAPTALLDDVKVARRRTLADRELANYWSWYLDTPAYSHAAYAVLALAVAGVLMVRRSPSDIVVAGLMLSAVAFTASFFVISIACDYRYLYFTDLAALAGAIYLAADPSIRGAGAKRASQASATSRRGRRAARKR